MVEAFAVLRGATFASELLPWSRKLKFFRSKSCQTSSRCTSVAYDTSSHPLLAIIFSGIHHDAVFESTFLLYSLSGHVQLI